MVTYPHTYTLWNGKSFHKRACSRMGIKTRCLDLQRNPPYYI